MSEMNVSTPVAQPVTMSPSAAPPAIPESNNAARNSASTSIPPSFLKAPIRPPSSASSTLHTINNTDKNIVIESPASLNPLQNVNNNSVPNQVTPPQTNSVNTPPQPPVSPQQYPVDNYLSQINQFKQTLDSERNEWKQREAQLTQALNNLVQERQAIARRLQDQSFDKIFDDEELANLESIDPNDAKIFGKKMMKALMGPLQQIGAQSQQQVEYLNNVINQQAQEIQGLRRQSMANDILKVHPDFIEMQSDPNFIAFMSQRNGISSKTRDQAAAEEFLLGNTAYVIDMLNQYKGINPVQNQVMSVPPVQTPTHNVHRQEEQQSNYSLSDLNRMMRMHHITPEQYSVELNKIRQKNDQLLL